MIMHANASKRGWRRFPHMNSRIHTWRIVVMATLVIFTAAIASGAVVQTIAQAEADTVRSEKNIIGPHTLVPAVVVIAAISATATFVWFLRGDRDRLSSRVNALETWQVKLDARDHTDGEWRRSVDRKLTLLCHQAGFNDRQIGE